MGENEPGTESVDASSAEAKVLLLGLARQAITSVVRSEPLRLPVAEALPKALRRPGAAFVTLTLAGALRGCVGQVMTQRPVCESVVEAATSAASRDSRFPPLTQRELPLVQVHLSLLNEPRYLSYSGSEDLLQQLRPGVDGVVLTVGGKMATFLPKVWEQVSSKADFLELLSLKAGLDRDAWKAPGALVSVYQTEDFAEPEAPTDPLVASN